MDTKTLWLIRHAKSDWPAGVGDFSRPLAERGHRQGTAMGAWLADQDTPAQVVLTSSARRAKETAAYICRAFGLGEAGFAERPALYHAGADDLLAVVRSLPEAVVCAAIVAHNPGLTHCVNRLAGEPFLDNLPTFGVARFEFASTWRSATFGSARLVGWMTPKRLPPQPIP